MSRRTRNLLAAVASFAIVVTGVSLLPPTAQAATNNLPGNTPLTNVIDTPADNSSQPGAFTLTGHANVGATPANPIATLIYVVDNSGSTIESAGTCGGDQNGDGDLNRILDCEIAAALALNQQAITSGSVAKVGAVQFDTNASVIQTLVVPNTPSIATNLKALRYGNATNFEDGVKKACTLAGSNPNTTVVFMSDGLANQGGNAVAAASSCPSTVTIKTFAVGTGSSCTGNPNGLGSLAQIAAAGRGNCTPVNDLSQLPSIVAAIAAPKISSVKGTIDGGAPVTLMTDPPTPPDQTSVTYSWNVAALSPGTHRLCTTAYGFDVGGNGSTTDCINVVVPDPVRKVSVNDISVNEGGVATFTLSLTGPTTSGATVGYATAGSSATAGDDYTSKSGTATFAPGSSSTTVSIQTLQDNIFEGPEQFALNLSSPSSNLIIDDGHGVATIVDDDQKPTVTIVGTPGNPDSPNTSVKEGDAGCTNVTLTIKLSNPASAAITVPWSTGGGTATAGTDYTTASGTVIFAPGETSKTITVCVKGDLVDEPNETFEVTLGTPTGPATVPPGTKSVVTIIDDDRNGSFSCQATGLRLLGLSTFLANGAYSPCMDSTGSLLALGLSTLVTVDAKVITAATDATPDNAVTTKPALGDQGKGDSEVTFVKIVVGGHTITADAVRSHAEASCQAPLGGTPKLSASTVLVNARIDGAPVVLVNGAAEISLNVGTLVGVKVWLNRTIVSGNGVTQRAIQVSGAGLLAAVDVVVAEARAGYTGNPCAS
ncbi:Calx-beta domain-containing protein [Marmoricola sp. RAF53]|uniref:vWA domain-containing protein n=1 Tax=Marmoricola sp. RAF53 TaxID=3233059 RepID=UPI003F9CB36E